MTEDEAETKWCPFARVLTADARDHYPAANRAAMVEGGQFTMNINPVHSRCIGSDCMAWRWWADREADSGFCGLAGFHYANQRGP